MIRILHLESSTRACSVVLSIDGKAEFVKESVADEFMHSEQLTVYIQDVLKMTSCSFEDLTAVSVASGPGSYTGLRIGVSTAKGLCYALGIPLIAVDSLVSLAVLAAKKHPKQKIYAMIDARRMEVYSAIYNSDLQILKPISADILTEESYSEFDPFIYIGDGAPKLAELWQGRGCVADLEIVASASGQVEIAFEKFAKQEFEDVAYFEPYYLKDFVAGVPSKR